MTAVVVVHGLWMPGAETCLLRRRLRAAGFTPVAFHYPTIATSLSESAARLAEFLDGLPGNTRHLVGHSLGGVVILKALERHAPPRIGRVVALGSPFAGSAAAAHLRALPGGRRLLGRAMAEWLDEGGRRRWSAAAPLGVIAGSRPLGMGRLLGRLPVPHDGTVGVSETALDGAADRLVLPVTHFSMLWSRAVAREVAQFLRDARFTH